MYEGKNNNTSSLSIYNGANTEDSLYIIVSKTNTWMGKFIRRMTQSDYNHISISLNSNLQPLYSFARYNVNAPLVGGFVEESWLRYLYKGKSFNAKIYRIQLDSDKYMKLQNLINETIENKEMYIYNTFQAMNYVIKRKGKERKYTYTCLSFAEKIMKEVEVLDTETDVFSIKQMSQQLEKYFVQDIEVEPSSEKYYWNNDQFPTKKRWRSVVYDTVYHFYRLMRV